LAQLRQDYPEFTRRNVEVIAVGPDSPADFRAYWERERIPFVGLADPRHTVANLYHQEVSLLKLGRMPSLVVVDGEGRIHYQHYASWMSDIPANAEVLEQVDKLTSPASSHGKLG
jgi:peroxiredoxin